METLEENSASDYKDCSDMEDDTTDVTESSYVKLLESNSAYNQLCDHASSMRIDELKLLNVRKNELGKNLSTSKATSVNSVGTAGTELKNVGVFHQVIKPVRPVFFSKLHDSLPGRKIIVKSLSFKEKHKDEAPVSVQSKSTSMKEIHEKHESTSVSSVDSGIKNECALKAKAGSCSVICVPVSDKINAKIELKSVILTRGPPMVSSSSSSTTEKSVSGKRNDVDMDDTPVVVLDVSNKAKQKVKPAAEGTVRDVRKDKILAEINDDDDDDVRAKVPTEKLDLNHKEKTEVKPTGHVHSDTIGQVRVEDETKDKVTPMPVKDDTSMNVPEVFTSKEVAKPVGDNTSSQSVRNDTHSDETVKAPTVPDMGEITSGCDKENAFQGICDEDDGASHEANSVVNISSTSLDVLAETKDKLGVIDNIPINVEQVNKTNEEANPELDVRADISADEQQDVNNANKEAKPGLDVRDSTPANEQDAKVSTKDESELRSDVRDCSTLDRQHDVDTTANMAIQEELFAKEEHVSGKDECNADKTSNESKRKVAAEPVCCADTELGSEEQNTIDECQDWTAHVDTYISDEKEDGTQERVHDVTVSGNEFLPKAIEEDTTKLQEGEITTEAHVESNYKEHTQVVALSEVSDYCHVSSTSHQLIKLKEDHSSLPVCSTSVTTRDDDESTVIKETIVDPPKTPVLHQYKPSEVCDDEFPLTGDAEPCEIKDSSNQGINEVDVDEKFQISTSNEKGGLDNNLTTLAKGSDQKTLVPAICEKSTVKGVEIYDNFDSMDASPPALQIDTEINSRCCTPTLDEPTYSQGLDEVSNIQEVNYQDVSETEDYCLTRSPNNTWLVLDSSEDSHSGLEKSPAHKEPIATQDPPRSHIKHDATVQVTDKSNPSLTEKHVPEENLVYFDHDAIPTARNTSEINHHREQFGSFSEQYQDDYYEDLHSSWEYRAYFKTEEQKDHGEWYAPDKDSHYTNRNSVQREFAYSPREITESNSDISGWIQRSHYSEASPNLDEATERVISFRHRTRLSESTDESESHGSEPVHYGKRKRKRRVCKKKWGEEDFDATVNYSIQKTFSCSSDRSSISRTCTSTPYPHKEKSKQPFDWRRYYRREGIFESNEAKDAPFHDPPSSIVTMFDKKGNRVILESPSTQKCSLSLHGVRQSIEEQQSNSGTQSLMEQEYLVFSEKMTHLLKNCKTSSRVKPQHRLNINPVESPMTIQFSRLDEQNSFSALDQTWPTHSKFKINVDMSERKTFTKTPSYSKPLHLQSLFCERGTEAACSKLSDISKECSKSYYSMMNDICIGKVVSHQNDELKRKWDIEHASTSKQAGFCGRIKKDMFNHLHDNLNSIVRQACKTKYKFYMVITSADPFFEETRVGK